MCNCKNKQPQQKQIMVQSQDAIEIVELEQPPYSIEEVIRVKEYFNTRIKTDEQKQFVIDWNQKYFEPQFQGYCDAPCFNRIQSRAEYAFEKCVQYQKYIMNGK